MISDWLKLQVPLKSGAIRLLFLFTRNSSGGAHVANVTRSLSQDI